MHAPARLLRQELGWFTAGGNSDASGLPPSCSAGRIVKFGKSPTYSASKNGNFVRNLPRKRSGQVCSADGSPSSSTSALAVFKSNVSKPSTNQL